MTKITSMKARFTASGTAIIPNTFQHPNIFVDRLMYFLTPEEYVVLTFAVRRIIGFQANIISRKDHISLSQFTDGIVSENGEILSNGCGLGIQSVRNCLDNLSKFKILIHTTEKPNPVKGQEYWLQENENVIDWEALEERKQSKKITYQSRTRKATKESLKSRGYVARKGNVARKSPVTSDVTEGVTSDVNTKPTETHRNPHSLTEQEKQQANAKMDAFLQAERAAMEAKKSGKAWKLRHKFEFNETILALADLCVSRFGEPSGNDVGIWLLEIGHWADVGVKPTDWNRAVEIVSGYSQPVVSVTGMTKAIKFAAQERKERNNRKLPNETTSDPEKVVISKAEAIARGLAKPSIGIGATK